MGATAGFFQEVSLRSVSHLQGLGEELPAWFWSCELGNARPDALGPRSCRSLLAEARDEVDRCGDDDRTEEVGQQCVT